MGCFDLMDAKARFDTYSEVAASRTIVAMAEWEVTSHSACKTTSGRGARTRSDCQQTATLLHGDVTEMMVEHIADASIDLAIADVPYFIRGSPETTATDAYIQRNGMKPLFQRGMGSLRQHRTV